MAPQQKGLPRAGPESYDGESLQEAVYSKVSELIMELDDLIYQRQDSSNITEVKDKQGASHNKEALEWGGQMEA